jgi:hypothetical protein
MCQNRPQQIVASLKQLKKPKNETEKYFAKLTSGVMNDDDDMEDISEGAEENDDHMTFVGTLPQITEVGTDKP